MKRPADRRQPPLDHSDERQVFKVVDDLKVYAAPRYKVFIEAMWHGDYQQVPVDPDDIPGLIEALRKAAVLADSLDVVAVEGA